MSNDVIQAVRQRLANAQDDLSRANMAFGRMTPDQLKEQHGQSGRTRGEIYRGYQDEVARWEKALAEVQ